MMALKRPTHRLIDRLPAVRGQLVEAAPLDRLTRFRVGGPAEVMFQPADCEDLQSFLAAKPADVALTVVGLGSNVLVRDGGVPGVVIRLGRAFARIALDGALVRAGAAALDLNVARMAAEGGLQGLEFLSGIPGSIGGALRMNAGAYGREIKDIVVQADAVTPSGHLVALSADELGLSYRHSVVAEDWVFTAALLSGSPGDPVVIAARMAEIQSTREESQPIGGRTGGSTFANPTDAAARGRKAWQLIDAAGCRGMRLGGALVSEQHCNFLINEGAATAADLEALGEEVRRRVYETSGVRLSWEIRIVGVPRAQAVGGPR
jgi:UDP-N-acetylmuramate dehydrogenase